VSLTSQVKTAVSDIPPGVDAGSPVRRLQIGCWVGLTGISLVRAWFSRYELMGGDSLAYLDIARAIAEGHKGVAIHSYWSPGYPILISLFLRAFKPNAYWEAPLVHLVNVLIFVGALACFQLFWREVLDWHRRSAVFRDAEIPDLSFWTIGFAVFGIASLNVVRVGLISPDLLVMSFCFLAGWSALRFRRFPSTWHSVRLGLVLALGYYAKAPFFPLAIAFIVCACLKWPMSRRIVLLGGIALVTFLLVCAPLVIALSRAKGRLTFGDSARLNYAFYIDGVQFYEHWQGGPLGSGMPIHPTRKLSEYPEIYEFAKGSMGTYPAWFDPTYWYEGVAPHFDMKRQVGVLAHNFALQFLITMESGAELVCVAIILVLLAGDRLRWVQRFRRLWFVWVPAAMALLMFALVHVEPRFLAGWLVLLFAGVICACLLPADSGTRKAVRCISDAALITVGAALVLQASREAIGVDHANGRSPRQASIATFLLHNGLHPGDGVALIGNGSEAYWAHLARVHLVSEIPAYIFSRPSHPALDFWESPTEQQQRALEILRQTGAIAVIAGSQDALATTTPSILPPQWKKIGDTGAYVYFFAAKQ
jgi:hypothetical protein